MRSGRPAHGALKLLDFGVLGRQIRVLAGWAAHRVLRIEGVWKISAKQVSLQNCDQFIRNPSIIF